MTDFNGQLIVFRRCRNKLLISFVVKMMALFSVLTSTLNDVNCLSAPNGTIRIGFLTNMSDPTYRLEAIAAAIDQARSNGLLAGFNFRFDSLSLSLSSMRRK
jgi:hypothetical protein